MMLTLQGCTSSHMFPPLSICTRHVLDRLQAKAAVGVDHDLTNHTSPYSRFIAYSGSIRRESGRRFHYGPERCVQGSQGIKRATRYTGPLAYRIIAHPS